MIRQRLKGRLLARIASSAEPLEGRWLERRTLVLAPHPDDETLGCGGLVATLRRRGVGVHIVFMTDGAHSHVGMDPELVSRRHREAIAASAVLGVEEADLSFLDYPDGGLALHEDEAAGRLGDLITELEPGQLVVPHWAEPNADHAATYRIADAAARRVASSVDALLAPVWVWDQFPWVGLDPSLRWRHGRRAALDLMSRSRVGWGMRSWLTHRLELGDVFATKRAALAMHESQVVRPPGQPDWPVLADVADGEWLGLLLRAEELYGTTVLGGQRA